MGLWDWIIDALTTGDDGPSRSTPNATSSSSATAVLDAPTDDQRDGDAGSDLEEADRWWAPEGITAIDPIGVELPERSMQTRVLEEKLISHFDGHDLTLPPMPKVAEHVLRRLRDPKCSASDVAGDLSEDQVIAASVLRIANSPLYRGVTKISSLQSAVARLGTGAIRTLMMHQSFRAAMFQQNSGDKQLAELIWHGSLAGAAIMRHLARILKRDEDEAFLIGLLHDIGNVITLRIVMEHERMTHEPIDIPAFEFLCHETHQEFGELITEAWGLPDDLKSLVADHHSYPEPDDPLRTERLMLILTDMISQMLGFAPPAQYDLANATVVSDLGLAGSPDFERLLAELPETIDKTVSSLS